MCVWVCGWWWWCGRGMNMRDSVVAHAKLQPNCGSHVLLDMAPSALCLCTGRQKNLPQRTWRQRTSGRRATRERSTCIRSKPAPTAKHRLSSRERPARSRLTLILEGVAHLKTPRLTPRRTAKNALLPGGVGNSSGRENHAVSNPSRHKIHRRSCRERPAGSAMTLKKRRH